MAAERTLRLGILQADNVLEHFQPCFGNYPGMFGGLLAQAAEAVGINLACTTVPLLQWPDTAPPAPDSQDAWLITGSRHSVYDDLPWIPPLEQFVRDLHAARRPLLGICFGHQLVAQALGGRTGPASQGWGVGIKDAPLAVAAPAWCQPPAAAVRLVASHKDQVLDLPPGATRLAGSSFCPNAAYTVGGHMLCVQGHPEFSKEYAAALMTWRRELLGEDVYNAGMQSLAQDSNATIVAQWLLRFAAAAAPT